MNKSCYIYSSLSKDCPNIAKKKSALPELPSSKLYSLWKLQFNAIHSWFTHYIKVIFVQCESPDPTQWSYGTLVPFLFGHINSGNLPWKRADMSIHGGYLQIFAVPESWSLIPYSITITMILYHMMASTHGRIQNAWFTLETPKIWWKWLEMDDLGVPLWLRKPANRGSQKNSEIR